MEGLGSPRRVEGGGCAGQWRGHRWSVWGRGGVGTGRKKEGMGGGVGTWVQSGVSQVSHVVVGRGVGFLEVWGVCAGLERK